MEQQKRHEFADSLFNPKPIKRPRLLDPLPEDAHPEEILYFFPAGHELPRAGLALRHIDKDGRTIDIEVYEVLGMDWSYKDPDTIDGVKVIIKGYAKEVAE